MPIPDEVMELENLSIGQDGQPTLAAAYFKLKDLWDSGDRDREVMLHLMFLAWYCLEEPPHITGLPIKSSQNAFDSVYAEELADIFNQVHEFVHPQIWQDAEMLYVVGLMAHLFPWALGDVTEWEERSLAYQKAYRALKPNGIELSIFQGRGAYGDYFAMHAKRTDGY
jgi:hypothetical protein